MKVLVSACLLGENCKYNGKNNYSQRVVDFVKDKEVVAICPELLAGLPAPRPPVELVDGLVQDKAGNDLHKTYCGGVQLAVEQIRGLGVDVAILQSRSPTCGVKQIYDGTFTGRLIDGQGLFARALAEAGCKVLDAEDV